MKNTFALLSTATKITKETEAKELELTFLKKKTLYEIEDL